MSHHAGLAARYGGMVDRLPRTRWAAPYAPLQRPVLGVVASAWVGYGDGRPMLPRTARYAPSCPVLVGAAYVKRPTDNT
jgi:hypothetical protein